MKKILLISVLALGITTVHAQRSMSSGPSETKVDKSVGYPEVAQPTPLAPVKNPRKANPNPSPAGAGNCVNPPNDDVILGSAGNALGTAYGTRTNLWYDKDINTMTFVHRSCPNVAGSTTLSDIRYDYSTGMGAKGTWNIDQAKIYATDAGETQRGRYPQGVIYNPSGNTTPTNAFINVYGPITDGSTTAPWKDHYKGTSQIGSSTHVQGLFPTIYNTGGGYIWAQNLDGMQIVKNTRTIWVVGEGTNATPAYDDSIFLAKGTFNGTDYTYDFSHTFYAFANDSSFADVATAWSDDGMIGYVVMLANDQNPIINRVLYPIVFKTVDGGSTFTKVSDYATNLNIDVLDPLLANGGYASTSAFDVDCALDKNNNLHIAVGIGAASATPYAISSGSGNWGVFDIYTNDGGSTWFGQLVSKPETFRGSFGAGTTQDPTIGEDSRPAVTRSWDGSKIFISWFDTDTINYPGVGNLNPDWYLRGYDVNTQNTTNSWTDAMYMTDPNTTPFSTCTFGNLSYYSVNHGSDEWLPMVYVVLQTPPTSTGEKVIFHYFDGGCVKGNSYLMTGHPCLLSTGGACTAPVFTVGIDELEKRGFDVSANYPNPFNGSTMVDVTLTKPADVTIEVSNMVGQILSTNTYKNLSTGKNQLTINASGFAGGLYLYKVKVGTEVVTRTMSVE